MKTSVLLVDDDPQIAWGIGRYLTRSGFKVNTCGDGYRATKLLESRSFDFLISDIQMPQVNGLSLLEQVRQHHPDLKVIIITAFGSPTIRDVALRKGALQYLEKPIDPKLLVELLNSVMSNDSFSGSIADIDLFDYVQLMLVTKRRALIEVTSRCGRSGVLFFDQGEVPHAEAGALRGEAAFFECLSFEGGTFATLPWSTPKHQTIQTRGDFLLMDAARFKDEHLNQPHREDATDPIEVLDAMKLEDLFD